MIYTENDFESIYRATVTRLSKHVFFKDQNLEDAQDLVQDLYFDLYKHMQQCTSPIEHPQAYLVQMANHALVRYYQEKLRRPVTVIEDTLDVFETIADETQLEQDVLDSTTADVLWEAILSLNEPEKSFMVARYRFDMSFVDLAKEFQLPETTIKSKVYKVLETLKKRFDT